MTIALELPDRDATLRAGAALSPLVHGGMVITLAGALGAGKTTLVRGMLRGLQWEGPVKSPTYALVEHYVFPSLYFYHFDLYRLTNSEEWDDTGFAEYFRNDSVCVIEWPERAAGTLPHADLALSIAISGDGRVLVATGGTEAGRGCEEALARELERR